MERTKTDKSQGRTLLALILNYHAEYTKLGYPADPAIYRVRVNKNELEKLKLLAHSSLGAIQKANKNSLELFGFKVEEDHRLANGEVIFGPEQVLIEWKD